jgi:hypothetical protein
MRTIIKFPLLLMLTAVFSQCRKTYDTPPFKPAAESAKINISQIKSRISALNNFYRFGAGDTNLYCTVTADETSGNFFRQVFVRDDEGGAIQLRLLNEGGLFTGDMIRVNLNNTYAVMANNMLYLDSVDVENKVVKLSSGNAVPAKVTTIGNILAGTYDPLSAGNLQSQLVELNGVEMIYDDRGKTFADAVGKTTGVLSITDCSGKKISLRSSGRSNFAGKQAPYGNGKLIAVVSQYNSEMQLGIRNYNELSMNGKTCTGSVTPGVVNNATFTLAAPVATLHENFDAVSLNEDFAQNGWINYNQMGSLKWKGSVKTGNYRSLRASSYATGENNVIWLISPPVVYKSSLRLSFKTGAEYWVPGHQEAVMAYVCTDFDGKNFAAANWTPLASALYADGADGNYNGPYGLKSSGWIELKSIDLLKNPPSHFFVAFKYSGTPVFTSNIYLDEILLE